MVNLPLFFTFSRQTFEDANNKICLFIFWILNLEYFTNKTVDIFILFPVDNTCYEQDI